MRITVQPPLDDATEEVLRVALHHVGLEPSPTVAGRTAWWRAGLDEGVERSPSGDDYALSPRSTRGATRA